MDRRKPNNIATLLGLYTLRLCCSICKPHFLRSSTLVLSRIFQQYTCRDSILLIPARLLQHLNYCKDTYLFLFLSKWAPYTLMPATAHIAWISAQHLTISVFHKLRQWQLEFYPRIALSAVGSFCWVFLLSRQLTFLLEWPIQNYTIGLSEELKSDFLEDIWF